ncbi:MAG: protein phosphatase CheZ [Burkholderiales bacterium]|nr:protein phosphatase CheZ [Burkholderiales bacterium]
MDFPPFDADAVSEVTPQEAAALAQKEVLARVGHMTRSLHDSLRGLGFDKLMERAATDIPDARDRLDYVARMTEKAAQRVLNATDAAGPLQDDIDSGARDLAAKWETLLSGAISEAQTREIAAQTINYLHETRGAAGATKQHLMDIMMAQDFQDLTGQVIMRVTELAHNLEQQLLQLLVDYAPAEVKREVNNSLMNGPQISPEGNSEVVANQGQVDDLLDSLGF